MKSLVLIELQYHNEVLRAYLLTLLESTYQISCLTNRFNYEQLSDFHTNPQINFIVKDDQESHAQYFKSNKELLNTASATLVITLPNNDSFFKTYQWSDNSAIVVHNYHSVFCPSEHTKGIVNYLGYAIASKLLGRVSYGALARQFNSFVIPSSTVYEYVRNSKKHKKMRLLGVCDFLINEISSPGSDGSVVKIVLPGRISQELRDYKSLYLAMKQIKDQLNKPIELNFLSTAKNKKGQGILQKFKSLTGPKITVLTNDSFITQEAYDRQMQSTDFLILPLLPKVLKQRHVKEKLGFSSVSGNIGDIVKFALPAILPSFYPLEPEVEAIVGSYTEKETLAQTILDWVNNCRYKEKRKQADALRQKYAPEQKLNTFLDTISRLEP